MCVVVHLHAGTFIETPDEIERLLAESDPELIGLLLDTGHLVYGGGDPVELLRRHGDRVRYVHLKDVDPGELRHARSTGVTMAEAWARGIFCPLGGGLVDFRRVVEQLRARDYAGWVIVEQDVVPDGDGGARLAPLENARRSRAFLRDAVGL
jgi:inosose dehydratase